MRATELMIGDWVEVIQSDHLKFVQVGEIHRTSIITKPAEYEEEEIDLQNIKSIPLTSKILEKNVFKKRNKYYYITIENKDTRYCVEYDTESKKLTVNNVWFVINEVRYVHELQHAMKLCGIDINIEL